MAPQKSAAAAMLDSHPGMRGEMEQLDLFTQLFEGLKRVVIEDETYFVAEGDTLLDEDQLLVYANEREAMNRAREATRAAAQAGLGKMTLAGIQDFAEAPLPGALLGMVENGRLVRWRPGTILTYCVLRNTFGSQQQYELVRENMRLATEEWQATCGIEFQHRGELDGSESVRPDGVIFPVRGIDANGAFIAAAFFPNDPVNRRRVLIDPSYFDTSFDKVGVLRHELGHVLGFRHEHIRSGAPPACPDEPLFGTFPLTDLDPRSVMHYFCGGAGSQTLAITETDRVGAQRVYGPPLSAFRLVA